MAEGVLFDIAKEIIGKAGNLALNEVALIWGVNDEINKLKERVSIISAVILDAEAKQHDSAEIKLWLQRLKDAMCDADDLLDEISTEALRREVMARDKKMRERLVAIAADRQFHLDEIYGVYKNLRNFSCRQLRKLHFVFATSLELHFQDSD